MPTLVGTLFGILLLGALLRRLKQPHVVIYLIAGLLLGRHGLGLLTDDKTLSRIGDVGVVLLLFFVGMELHVHRLLSSWKVFVLGTAAQIAGSVGVAVGVGLWLDWPLNRLLLIGLAISLSSTAVVVSLLRARGDLDSEYGRDAVGILLVQDLAVIPMLIVVSLLAGRSPSGRQVGLQLVGGVAIVALLVFVIRHGLPRIPGAAALKRDHELQVFLAFLLCFGLALITGLLGLSTALGAFVAGMILAAARETDWVHKNLEPFRVILVALFFVSIGMLVDLRFVADHALMVLLLALAALLLNTGINTIALRIVGRSWRAALRTGAILAQIGEFSFVLVAVGRGVGLVTGYAYQTILAVIAATLLFSPAWIIGFEWLAGRLGKTPGPPGPSDPGPPGPSDPVPPSPSDPVPG